LGQRTLSPASPSNLTAYECCGLQAEILQRPYDSRHAHHCITNIAQRAPQIRESNFHSFPPVSALAPYPPFLRGNATCKDNAQSLRSDLHLESFLVWLVSCYLYTSQFISHKSTFLTQCLSFRTNYKTHFSRYGTSTENSKMHTKHMSSTKYDDG
jgi:hypothetical protein